MMNYIFYRLSICAIHAKQCRMPMPLPLGASPLDLAYL
jgi:hypothetical protein